MEFAARKNNNGLLKAVFCLLANFVCFGICYYVGLPMRLEHVGSFYAATAFGIGPAIVVAVISQLVYSLFYFGFSNILMLIPVIITLWLICAAVRFGWVDTIISSFGTMTLASLLNLVFVTLVSFIIGRAFLGRSCWFDMFETLSRHLQYNTFEASLVTVVPYAVLNVCLTWIISMFAYRITPKQTTLGFSDTIYKKRLQNRK